MYISGVRFDNVTMREAVNKIILFAQGKKPRHVCTGNLDHLRIANEHAPFYEAYWNADLVVADGKPVVWLSKAQGEPLKERVAGVDLFERVCAAAAKTGLRVYLLGGEPMSAERACARLREEHPNIQVVGTDCPSSQDFTDPVAHEKVLDRIMLAKPDILFVALGAPKQELWIAEVKHKLGVPVSIGVGGTFELYAGVKKRAPEWMRSSGTEWLFRLSQEPTRLFERYVLRDMPFMALALARVYSQRKAPQNGSQLSCM